MNNLKSHFGYDKRKRNGILFFAILLVICTLVIMMYNPEVHVEVSQEESLSVLAFQKEIDSLKIIEVERRKPKIFPFNPTLLTDFNGYKLGLSTEEIDRVVRFRESGKWLNSNAQFKEVSGISDSLLEVISPYFKWPKWLEEQKNNPKRNKTANKTWKTIAQKGALNSVSYNQLLALDGMTDDAASRVIRHRDQIGGYQVDFQIHSVYGVDKNVKRLILDNYTVKNKPVVHSIGVNKATASDLSTVPLLDFDLAKEVVDYRILHEGIKSLKELKDLEGMTDFKYDIIKLYLHID